MEDAFSFFMMLASVGFCSLIPASIILIFAILKHKDESESATTKKFTLTREKEIK